MLFIFNKSMNQMFKFLTLLLSLTLLGVLTAPQETEQLQLNLIYNVTLEPQVHKKYQIEIPSDIESDENLFISAESTHNDPFEVPFMNIVSDDGDISQQCFEEESDYTDICELKNESLKPGRVFFIEVYCLVKCDLRISAYLNENVKVQFNKNYVLNSYEGFTISQLMELTVGDQQFTEITLSAIIQNINDIRESIRMYINYGKNASIPTDETFDLQGEPTFAHILSITLSKQQIFAGDSISVLMVIPPNAQITFSANLNNGNNFNLTMNEARVQVCSFQEDKMYTLDLSSENLTEQDVVSFSLIVYSGDPSVLVSFDPDFPDGKIIDNQYIEKSMSFMITDGIREELGFSGKIYVKVSCYWNSNFLLSTSLNRKNFVALTHGVTQIVQMTGSDIKNFIFEDTNTVDSNNSKSINYKLTVEMIEGTAQLGIKICRSLQENNTLDCLILSKDQLQQNETQDALSEISKEQEQELNVYTLYFNYDVNQCPQYQRKSGQALYLCDYQVIVLNRNQLNTEGEDNKLIMAITMEKRVLSKYLQEGKPTQDSVMRQSANYYAFILYNVSQVASLSFSVTTIQGDTSLITSTTSYFPTLEDSFRGEAMFSISNYITYEGEDLTAGVYYVSVYGYEESEYTITPIIRRIQKDDGNDQDNNGRITEISLSKGETQSFNMKLTKDEVFLFSFTADASQALKVQVLQIKGQITYTVKEKQSLSVLCDSTDFVSSDQLCQFNSTEGKKYLLTVQALIKDNHDSSISFSASFWSDEGCISYPLNVPFYVLMKPNQHVCYNFVKNLGQSIEIAFSMTAYQLLQNKIQIKARFPVKQLEFKDHEKIITADELDLLCLDDGHSSKKCQFTLEFVNVGEQRSSLYGSIQTSSTESILFEGLPEKTVTISISQSNPKRFYYYLNTPYQDDQKINGLIISLHSKTEAFYQVAAAIVTSQQYAQDYENKLYPEMNSNNPRHRYVNSNYFQPVTVLSLDPNEIITNFNSSNLYIVLISVYPIQFSEDVAADETFIFEIQATQKQNTLPFGGSRLGYAEKGEVLEYIIEPNQFTPSILSIRSMNGLKCFNAFDYYVKDGITNSFEETKTFDQENGRHKILVQGTSEELCTFQISFSSLQNPITTIYNGIPYNAYIGTQGQIKYFLYEHTKDEGFEILPILDGGNAQIFVEPLDVNSEISEFLTKNVDRFSYKGVGLNAAVHISKNDQNYCVKCNYLIAVKGELKVSMELYVNLDEYPIPLKEGSFLKDSIQKDSTTQYEFYSLITFNVTIRVLSGQVNLQVMNPDQRVLVDENIKDDQEFVIPEPANVKDEYIDFFNDKTKFKISIKGIDNSAYYISIHKRNVKLKIVEGLPISIQLPKQRKQTIEFQSYDAINPIYVLIQNLNYTSDAEPVDIKFEAQATSPGKTSRGLVKDVSQVEGSYNLELRPFEGSYFLSITSSQYIKIEMVVAKKQFTHLVAARSALMKHEGMFQIFSPGTSIMFEMFVCEGDISLTASSNISKLIQGQTSDEGLVHMQHANYGGHYVVTAKNLSGEYFVKINQESTLDNLLYMTSYYLIDTQKGEQIPYKIYGINSLQIQYQYHQGKIEFLLNPLERKDHGKMTENIVYKLYIAETMEAITNITRCSLGNVYSLIFRTENATSSQTNSNMISFQIENGYLRNLIKGGNSFFVGAEAVINLKQASYQHVNAGYYVYDVAQLLLNNSPQFRQENENLSFVFIWIVVPFIIGAILLFLAARYCIKSMSAYPSSLVEEDLEFGQSQDVLQNSNNIQSQ